MAETELDSLRQEMTDTDTDLYLLIAERMRLAEKVGRYKARNGLKSFQREQHQKKLADAHDAAIAHDVDPDLFVGVVSVILDGSVEIQRRVIDE